MTSEPRRRRFATTVFRRFSPTGWRTVCSLAAAAALLLAGCGGRDTPKLDRADAAPLIVLAERIAGRQGCAAQARDIRRLSTKAIALVNAHGVPPNLQETMLAKVNALSVPPCGQARARDLQRWLERYSG